jgi:RNA-directed DNA polymerase
MDVFRTEPGIPGTRVMEDRWQRKALAWKSAGEVDWESDEVIVVRKRSNKFVVWKAETVERRASAERSLGADERAWTQSHAERESGHARVRKAAREDRALKFNNLLHHVSVSLLRQAYQALSKDAARGVDGEDWHSYGDGLEVRLERLHRAIHNGSYQPRPVLRKWIPKADGRQRPLGVTCVEDKVVQKALVMVLEAIYEEDFLGFSYGFRPGRGQHDALDAVFMAITIRKVNFVLDADIQSCFDCIPHDKLLAVLGRRITDRRVLQIISDTLQAGVMDAGEWKASEMGVPQGAVISPLLANVYLHDAIDRWVHGWRELRARGMVSVVRYADDFVMGFQYRDDGIVLRRNLEKRLALYGLKLHPEKTRLIEFGRFAQRTREARGEGKPESFNFLGFSHFCGARRSDGGFALHRRTISKRIRGFLQETAAELRARWNWSVAHQGAWLRSKVQGYFEYHGVPGNRAALETVRREVAKLWLRRLRRRSEKHVLPWSRMTRWIKRWIPSVRIIHPYPNQRFAF